jgi:RHS repeat-associated protein
LLSQTLETAGVIHKRVTNTYLASNAGHPFPANAGDIPKGNGVADLYGNPLKFRHLPLKKTVTEQDGATFTQEATAFDVFVRPTSVHKSTSLGFGKIENTEYHHDLNTWVLGQMRRQSTANAAANGQATTNSMVTSEIEYNAQALPWKVYQFGKLLQMLSYWPDGKVNTAADGRGNVTWLGDYHRGIPRLIGYTDGTTESATVNDHGWITSATDETGAKTCYGYDTMGRLASVVYPSETQSGVCDASRWYPKTTTFQQINSEYYGLPAGHWRSSTYEGGKHVHIHYDAMWRPVVEEAFDAGDGQNTLSQVVKRYDNSGRLSFVSYPQRGIGGYQAALTGTRTSYDALDRVLRVEQDSEHGVLATTTEYLPGLQVRTTNPRGFQTTTSFMAWDQPVYDLPILSQQPEGKTIQIGRHPQFGWPLALTQRNAAGTLSQTRRYVYDTHAQLCKTIELETGATVTEYDAAGSPLWSASGLAGGDYANPLDCSRTAANASGRVVNRVYDARNRLTHLNFPDGRGNQIWGYTADGLPANVTTYNAPGNAAPVVNAYVYNQRRLLSGESVSQPGWYTWSIGYGYDALANLASHTYPTGLVVDYAPNALGQATKAGSFASGAQYYPNGALKQFTYGNGIVHSMTQNARQLPQRVTSSGGVLDDIYLYDANGNPEHIANNLAAGYDPRDRWMNYDGLDRLTGAGAGMFGGTDNWHRYTYDALDNITSWKLAGVKDYADYVYDPNHRLTSIRNTAGATVVGLAYDPQGNLQNKNGQTYGFDFGNRLREVTGKEYYRYDGHGRRVLAWSPTTDSILSQYAQNGQLIYQANQRGNAVGSEHIYLASSLIATREWSAQSGFVSKYQHTDALGSPVAVTNSQGQVIERNDYEPYGAIIGKPNHNGIGYTGDVMDGVTRLTYMQQRYYDQSIGRFLSVDPVTANAKTGANFNRYWYANNNPYKFIDPDGREAACVTLRVNCFNSGGTFEEKAKALAGLAVLTVGSLFGPSGVAAIFEKPATAVSAINQVAEIGAGDALGGATLTASVTTAAKISHLFDHKKHGLDALVEASGGSRENAFAALQKAADQALADGQLIESFITYDTELTRNCSNFQCHLLRNSQ